MVTPVIGRFPHGSCSGAHAYDASNTGCGWISVDEQSYYIEPYANLSGAKLIGASLSGANLVGANLAGANLSYAVLSESITPRPSHIANLTNANLVGANLSNGFLPWVDLSGANLSGAFLIGTNLTGADLTNAILTNVTAANVTTCPNGVGWKTKGDEIYIYKHRAIGVGGCQGTIRLSWLDLKVWQTGKIYVDGS
ncbi:MAG: pentapeptide repeat-containing protein [bacterium]